MRKTRHSHKKPDFLAVLVILVAVSVLVSATLQAHVESSTETAVMAAQLEKDSDMALQPR
jgi:uncharacterized membrane protein